MGMKESPCSGYTIEAIHLRPAIVEDKRDQFDALIEDADKEGLESFCREHMVEGVPRPESFFQLGDEDTGDDEMELGVIYAYYDQSDLYELKLKPDAKDLEHLIGPLPTLHSWTIYG